MRTEPGTVQRVRLAIILSASMAMQLLKFKGASIPSCSHGRGRSRSPVALTVISRRPPPRILRIARSQSPAAPEASSIVLAEKPRNGCRDFLAVRYPCLLVARFLRDHEILPDETRPTPRLRAGQTSLCLRRRDSMTKPTSPQANRRLAGRAETKPRINCTLAWPDAAARLDCPATVVV